MSVSPAGEPWQLITSLARSTASEVSQSTLRKDISRTLPAPSEATVAKLLELLERVFILETIQPWAVSLRSKARLRRSPKYHSADPALAAAALRADTSRLSTDLAILGFLYESAAIHDLLVHTEALGGHLYHYRDSNGHEIDAVITMPNGSWAAIEVEVGGGQVQRGAQSLASAIAQIDMAPPAWRSSSEPVSGRPCPTARSRSRCTSCGLEPRPASRLRNQPRTLLSRPRTDGPRRARPSRSSDRSSPGGYRP